MKKRTHTKTTENRADKKKQRASAVFLQELRRDWNTLKSLSGRQKLVFIWDYYRWRIAAGLFAVFVFFTAAHMLWEGQRPCRLRICVVLNTDDSCGAWFQPFINKLQADGKPGMVDLNEDQPFDYDNQYYYVQEIEVMTTVSSRRMDAAICGPDMYSYLLAINACMPLDESLSDDLASFLADEGRLVYDTANLTIDENGNVDPDDGIDGYYAVDLSGTEFDKMYNQTEDEEEPLYAVVISNTDHLEDCEALLRALVMP